MGVNDHIKGEGGNAAKNGSGTHDGQFTGVMITRGRRAIKLPLDSPMVIPSVGWW